MLKPGLVAFCSTEPKANKEHYYGCPHTGGSVESGSWAILSPWSRNGLVGMSAW